MDSDRSKEPVPNKYWIRRHMFFRIFSISTAGCFVAYAVAVAINPALAVVPAKIAAGGGVVTHRVAAAAGTSSNAALTRRRADCPLQLPEILQEEQSP